MSDINNSQEEPQEKMLMCPLLALQPRAQAVMPGGRTVPSLFPLTNDCRREGCAWWHPELQLCSERVSAVDLRHVTIEQHTAGVIEDLVRRVKEVLLGRGLAPEDVEAMFCELTERQRN